MKPANSFSSLRVCLFCVSVHGIAWIVLTRGLEASVASSCL